MADPIGSLYVELAASTAKFMSDLEKAQAKLKQTGKAGEEWGQSFAKSGKMALGLVTAIASVTGAATAMAVAAGRQAEALTQLSSITGINTDQLQEWDVALNRVGLSGEDMTVMMRTLSKNLEEARLGTGTAADRFRQLGVDITKVTGTNDLLRKVTDSVSKFASGTEKAAIVGDLLGKSGLKFIPVMEGGAKALDEAAAASKRLGETLNTTQLETLNKMDDSIDDMNTAWKRFGQQVGAFIAPGVELVARLLTEMLAIGSTVFKEMNVAADTLAIRFTHLALAISEVAGVLFSTSVMSGDAWAQVGENLKVIDAEATKLIAKRRALEGLGAPEDTRAKPAPLVDSKKAAAQAKALADAQLAYSQTLFANEKNLADARLQKFEAGLDSLSHAASATDLEIAQSRQAALEKMDQFTEDSILSEINNYQKASDFKKTLFTKDAQGREELAKFEIESSTHLAKLTNDLSVAMINADTRRIKSATATADAVKKARLQPLEDELAKQQSLMALQEAMFQADQGMFGVEQLARQKALELIEAEGALRRQVIEDTVVGETRKFNALMNLEDELEAKRMDAVRRYPSFVESQLQAVVQSNAFSVASIVSNWTSGLATAIVQWDNFNSVIRSAWTATQVALVQGLLNTLVQWVAKYAESLLVQQGLDEASAAAKQAILGREIVAHAGMEQAKTAMTAAAETERVTLATAASGLMKGIMAAGLAGVGAIAIATVTAMGFAVGTVVAMMGSIATALQSIPVVGNALGASVAAAAVALAIAGGTALAGGIETITGAVGAGAAAVALGSGGIVTDTTLAAIGEAGSAEAVIPLNAQGAGFMKSVLSDVVAPEPFMGAHDAPMPSAGGDASTTRNLEIHVHSNLNGRELAHEILDFTIEGLRLRGATV